MPVKMPSTTSYSKRQLDLEVLQSLQEPVTSYTEVVPSATALVPKIVAGPQKLVQRYAVLFTTITDSDIVHPGEGTELYGIFDTGNVGGAGMIRLYAEAANSMARRMIKADDENEATFGKQPADEKLDDSWIRDVVVDRSTRSISIYVSIRSAAGSVVTFVVPTSAGVY